jgi:hypothetical protein
MSDKCDLCNKIDNEIISCYDCKYKSCIFSFMKNFLINNTEKCINCGINYKDTDIKDKIGSFLFKMESLKNYIDIEKHNLKKHNKI